MGCTVNGTPAACKLPLRAAAVFLAEYAVSLPSTPGVVRRRMQAERALRANRSQSKRAIERDVAADSIGGLSENDGEDSGDDATYGQHVSTKSGPKRRRSVLQSLRQQQMLQPSGTPTARRGRRVARRRRCRAPAPSTSPELSQPCWDAGQPAHPGTGLRAASAAQRRAA